ncbi:phage portal protein [Spirosoma fluminis]
MLDKFRLKLAAALAPGVVPALASGRLNYLLTGQTISVLPSDALTYINAYLENDIVYAVQHWKAKKIAACPPVLFRVKDKAKFARYMEVRRKDDIQSKLKAKEYKEQALEPVDSHRILDVFNNPNPMQTRFELMYAVSTMYDIVGTSFLYGNKLSAGVNKGQVSELWRLQEYGMMVEGFGYMKPPTQYRVMSVKDAVPAEKVLHMKRFNPLAEIKNLPQWGLSILEPLRLSVLTKHKYANEAETEAFQNRGPRKLVFPKDGATLDEFDIEQVKQVQDDLDKKLAKGSFNKVIANTVALDGLDIGASPVDLNIIESYDAMLEKTCGVYHVRKEALSAGKQSTYNNLTEARKYSITDGVVPDLMLHYDKLNSFFVGSYNTDREQFYMEPDLDFFHELQDDQNKKADYLSKLALTENQRLEAFGYEPHPHPLMGVPMVPSGRVPITDFENMDGEDDDVEGED